MPLTQAELLARANEISGRAETDVTEFLKNVIHDLENESVFLEYAEEITLVNGQRNYALSSLTRTYRLPAHLQVRSGSEYFQELDQISYSEYRERLKSNPGNSKPRAFAIFNDVIYLDPPPLATTYDKMDIWGVTEHGDSVATILYPVKFRDMLSNGIAWEIFKRYGLTDEQKARDAKMLYEDQKQKFTIRKATSKHHFVRYTDL